MKNKCYYILIILTFILSGLLNIKKCSAQIILEHTIDSVGVPYFYYTDIGNNDFKYVFLNQSTNSFSLYNLNMDPYLTNINIPVTNDSILQGFGVVYITKSLFDCDTNNIEYVFENPYDVFHKFRILRTDGTLLLEVDSANGPWAIGGLLGGAADFRPIVNTNDGAKLFLQKFDNNSIPQILIYSLCGNLPSNVFDFKEIQLPVKLFPNPSKRDLTFEFVLPNNQEDFSLKIFDSSVIEILDEKLRFSQNKININVENFCSGIYFYSIVSNNRIYSTGKFTIIK
jgi:hypothetical protein